MEEGKKRRHGRRPDEGWERLTDGFFADDDAEKATKEKLPYLRSRLIQPKIRVDNALSRGYHLLGH